MCRLAIVKKWGSKLLPCVEHSTQFQKSLQMPRSKSSSFMTVPNISEVHVLENWRDIFSHDFSFWPKIFQLKEIVQTGANIKAMKQGSISNYIMMIGAMRHPATQPSKNKGGAGPCKKELKASCKKELKASSKKELKASCTKELKASCNQSYQVAKKVQRSTLEAIACLAEFCSVLTLTNDTTWPCQLNWQASQ